MEKKHLTAVILAAGSSTRMGGSVKKQMLPILGKTVLWRTLSAFEACELVDSVVLAAHMDDIEYISDKIAPEFKKIKRVIAGGNTRAESARLSFEALPEETTHIAVHDGARCLVTPDMISKVACEAFESGAATAGSYVTDTVKLLSVDGAVEKTVPREKVFMASTPQIFETEVYKKALLSTTNACKITDDNMMVEALGVKISAVDLGKENIKITTPSDIELAEYILSKREKKAMTEIRVGHGYDVHRFAEERKLILGGVEIPFELGLLGHSDADVLTHAIMDALLGAAALGDIGRHFPDSDEKYRGICSIELLRRVKGLLENNGYIINNIDATLVMQKPKIAGYIDKMVFNISEALNVSLCQVNIKATTEEKLGFTGSGEGAAAHAVALIEKK